MVERKTYGTLGKVGVLAPASGIVATTDFHRWLHKDISIISAPIPIKNLTPDGLNAMNDHAEDTAKIFMEYTSVDLAFYSCTSGSFIGGKGYDAYLCNILKEASGAKEAYTTTTSVLKAMKSLNSKKISIITPYSDDINQIEKSYFESEGLIVNNISGIKTKDSKNQRLIEKIEPDDIYKFAIENTDKNSDTLFLSCTGLTVLDIIYDLERELKIPVVSSNQCAIWLIGKHFNHHGANSHRLGYLFDY